MHLTAPSPTKGIQSIKLGKPPKKRLYLGQSPKLVDPPTVGDPPNPEIWDSKSEFAEKYKFTKSLGFGPQPTDILNFFPNKDALWWLPSLGVAIVSDHKYNHK